MFSDAAFPWQVESKVQQALWHVQISYYIFGFSDFPHIWMHSVLLKSNFTNLNNDKTEIKMQART